MTLPERPPGARTEPGVLPKVLPPPPIPCPRTPSPPRSAKPLAETMQASSSSGGLAGQAALLLIPEMLAQRPGDQQ